MSAGSQSVPGSGEEQTQDEGNCSPAGWPVWQPDRGKGKEPSQGSVKTNYIYISFTQESKTVIIIYTFYRSSSS